MSQEARPKQMQSRGPAKHSGRANMLSPDRALRAAGGQPQAADPHLPGDCSPSCQAEIKVIAVSLGEGVLGPAATAHFGPSEGPGPQVRRQESQVTALW